MNGCHSLGHEDYHLFRPPKNRTEFWPSKIENNQAGDTRNYAALRNAGWKVIVVWECGVSKKLSISEGQLEKVLSEALVSDGTRLDIRG